MNKQKIEKVFDEIKKNTDMTYAITNADEYGDCTSCVNNNLVSIFGEESTGIWTKHWFETELNQGPKWEELKGAYIAHCITEEQGEKMIEILKNNG